MKLKAEETLVSSLILIVTGAAILGYQTFLESLSTIQPSSARSSVHGENANTFVRASAFVHCKSKTCHGVDALLNFGINRVRKARLNTSQECPADANGVVLKSMEILLRTPRAD